MALRLDSSSPTELVMDDSIPYALARALFEEMNKHLNDSSAQVLKALLPDNDVCVLRRLVDGPCGLLQEVNGTRRIVFVPLRLSLRRGVAWTKKQYWIR
ncbi:hypothetical protein ACEQ8H_003590 [Pleosporales sp. CAS-2024a]